MATTIFGAESGGFSPSSVTLRVPPSPVRGKAWVRWVEKIFRRDVLRSPVDCIAALYWSGCNPYFAKSSRAHPSVVNKKRLFDSSMTVFFPIEVLYL